MNPADNGRKFGQCVPELFNFVVRRGAQNPHWLIFIPKAVDKMNRGILPICAIPEIAS
jgi:hypothetical protein